MHTAVSILRIIDRVVIGLCAGKFQIKIHLRRYILGNEEPSDRIDTDIFAQLAQRNGVACALAHLHFFAVFDHAYHLNQINSQCALGITKRSQCALHTCDVAVVVRSPKVNQVRIASFDFINVVCNIRCKVGQGAIALAQNAVFIIAVFCAPEPEGSILLIGQAHVLHAIEAGIDSGTVILIEERLMAPAGNVAAEQLQVILNLGQFPIDALLLKVGEAFSRVGVQPLITVSFGNVNGDLLYVFRMITVFRQWIFFAEIFKIAGDQRLSEHDNLVAGIVDIILSQNIIAGLFHQTADAVAPGSVARMSTMEVSGRIGGYPLNEILLSIARIVAAIGISGINDLIDHGRQRTLRNTEIDKAGVGHFNAGNLRQFSFQLFNKSLGNDGRTLMQGFCKAHGDRRRIITHLRVLRYFNDQQLLINVDIINFFDGVLYCFKNSG